MLLKMLGIAIVLTCLFWELNPLLPGPIGPQKSDPVFLKIRDVFILFFDAALISYSIFNSAQFDVWNIPVKNHSVVMNFAFIFSIYPN
jgi:hypothetical protein